MDRAKGGEKIYFFVRRFLSDSVEEKTDDDRIKICRLVGRASSFIHSTRQQPKAVAKRSHGYRAMRFIDSTPCIDKYPGLAALQLVRHELEAAGGLN